MLTPSMKETVVKLNNMPHVDNAAELMEEFFGERENDDQMAFLDAEAKLLQCHSAELIRIMDVAPGLYEAITEMRGIALSYQDKRNSGKTESSKQADL